MLQKEANELWQVHGAYYDLNTFAKVHPGGVEQIIAQKGQDCTNLFETVHLFEEQPKKLLASYYVRDVPNYTPTLVWTGDGFYPTLKRRVKDHFRGLNKRKTGIYKNSNPNLAHHGTPFYHAVALTFVATLYILYYGSVVKGYALCAFLWGFFAFGCGGIGHEALHSGTFTTPRRNRLACFALLDVVGISSFMYQRVHSFGHHMHTNERGVDPDIEVHMPGCRLSQHQERLPMHWWQCYSAFPLYAISLPVSSMIDIKALITGGWGHYEYPTPIDFPRPIEFFGFVAGKIAFGLTLGCPLFNPYLTTAWALRQTTLMFVAGSFVTVLTFAVSHQNRKCFQYAEALADETDFGSLQVKTTCNFGAPMWQLLHCAGLGYQVEHHLFPTISVCHLPAVSTIVMETAAEFGLPYHYYSSWFAAVYAHYEYLNEMGRNDIVFSDQPRPVVPCAYPSRPLYSKRWVLDNILYPSREKLRGPLRYSNQKTC